MSIDPRRVGRPQAAKQAVVHDLSPRLAAAMGVAFKPADKIGYLAISLAVIAAITLAVVGVFAPRRPASETVESTLLMLSILAVLIGFGSVGAFVKWLQQVHRNLLALGNAELCWSLNWATWSCLIPFANLCSHSWLSRRSGMEAIQRHSLRIVKTRGHRSLFLPCGSFSMRFSLSH